MMHYYQPAAASSSSSESSESWSSSSWGGRYDKTYVRQLQSMTSSEALESMIVRLASGSAVVIFSVSSCCMCHAVKSLLCGMGVNPTVYELDHLVDPTLAKDIERALVRILGNCVSEPTSTSSVVVVPVVFIGGKLLGPMDRVMASHINGTLVPLLKQAGALWL